MLYNYLPWINDETRITAIVVQAAEASRLTDTANNEQKQASEQEQANASNQQDEESSSLMKETAEIESLLRRLQDNGAMAISDHNDMHQLLEIASTQGKGHNNNSPGQQSGVTTTPARPTPKRGRTLLVVRSGIRRL